MADLVLVVNAGSSSIKLALYRVTSRGLSLEARGLAEGLGGRGPSRIRVLDGQQTTLLDEALTSAEHAPAIDRLLRWLDSRDGNDRLVTVGHRVVHGGPDRSEPVVLNPAVLNELALLEPLAPLHQMHNLAPPARLAETRPELLQVACFDTAFHRTQPPVAQQFALPRRYTAQGVLRYGFHGLSYQSIAAWLQRNRPELHTGHIVVAHLGNGASLCGMRAGRSLATSMGFTALDGLPMGTRCGSLDPGVVLYLMDNEGLGARELEDLLYRRSGLLGVSGISQDMRELLQSGEKAASEAVELYCYRAAREIASVATGIGGLDGLVFTAGIGENAAAVREQICRHLAWLGVDMDRSANAGNAQTISSDDSRVPVLVVATDEEAEIARQALALAAD
ncbi:acetate/propionate family kinase [Methylonatrum kenyense]|uniref:acetate/propionate family kinase n=1 Tax=Methylonatrum kenyense TaxID=455253 RepID=UPI0020BD7193|nr:acetate/propionate family kinase [Methylonatrum kenyense]MCK8517019.1 acetate/propionate family kinase [Methylonatrum kenyense]